MSKRSDVEYRHVITTNHLKKLNRAKTTCRKQLNRTKIKVFNHLSQSPHSPQPSAVEADGKKVKANGEEAGKTMFVSLPVVDLPCKRNKVSCSNGGTCMNLNTVHWLCACHPAFRGSLCEEVNVIIVIVVVVVVIVIVTVIVVKYYHVLLTCCCCCCCCRISSLVVDLL